MMDTRQRIGLAALAVGLAACGSAETMEPVEPRPAPPADSATTFPSEPPPPAPVENVDFPAFAERTLDNGARLIVVENREQPVVSVRLVLPGGSAADPDGLSGLASVTASLIDQGTETRTAAEIAEAVDFLGARLSAGASSEWTSVNLTTLTDFLDEGLELMSDVVLNPVFPEDELETERQQRLSTLKLEQGQPRSIARKTFMERIYGEHPYGRSPTVQSIEAMGTGDLEAFHERHFRPGDALFVVAGDIQPDAAAATLENAFAGWAGAGPRDAARPEPPSRADRTLVFVHKPGSVQAVIYMGHLFPSATGADWPAVDVANQILGAGAAGFRSWMMQTLREEKGYTYGAYSFNSERQGPGYIGMFGEYRNEVADSALSIMLELADRIRRAGAIPPEDLEGAKAYLTGSFPIDIETPSQVASQVANNRLLGRPDRYLEEYRSRVAGTGSADIAATMREHFHPDRMAVVVVGDALEVLDPLRPFADDVVVVDVEGDPVDMAALTARAAAAAGRTFDASGLEPRTFEYAIMFQGNEVGMVTTRWAREAGTFTVTTAQQAPGMVITQTTEFGATTFDPIRAVIDAGPMGEYALEVRDGRVVGRGLDPQQGPQEVDVALERGTAFEGQFDVAVALTDLADAGEVTLDVLTSSGTKEQVSVVVEGEETVEVPAGSFETYRLGMSGQQPMTVWVTKSAPHIVVKRELAGQPVSIVLKSM